MADPKPRKDRLAKVEAAIKAYSEGRIARSDVAEAMGEAVSFGELLIMLGARDLPLPRFKSDPASPGRRLLDEIIRQHAAGPR